MSAAAAPALQSRSVGNDTAAMDASRYCRQDWYNQYRLKWYKSPNRTSDTSSGAANRAVTAAATVRRRIVVAVARRSTAAMISTAQPTAAAAMRLRGLV